ncbi:DUF7685 domain-containing protein [Caballeronia catudaia]
MSRFATTNLRHFLAAPSTDSHVTISVSSQRRPLAGSLMTQSRCDRCSATGPAHDFVSAASDGTWRVLCSRCFNTEMGAVR